MRLLVAAEAHIARERVEIVRTALARDLARRVAGEATGNVGISTCHRNPPVAVIPESPDLTACKVTFRTAIWRHRAIPFR